MNKITCITATNFNNFFLGKMRLIGFLFLLTINKNFAQNIFSGEPVQVVGQMNGYSTAASSNSSYRRVSVGSGTPTDGRGQWVKTYNVQSSGGDFTPRNMTGGGGSGFIFITGPSSNRFQNKWAFSGVGAASVNAVNGISAFNSGNDMGLNMNTAGRYTFVFNDVGYTQTNAKFYVAYTANAPVTVTRSSQTLNFDRSANLGITTSATPSSGENIYVRYTTSSDFTTSTTVVQATGSGTSWTATIPSQTIGSTVRYYVFGSTISLASLNGMSEIDKSLSVINYDDNSSSNYSYTLTSSYTSSQTGNFNTSSTWGGSQLFDGASYTIANTHTVTLNENATISGITINSGGTFVASDATPRTLTIASGGTITNNGTFTAGTGTVAFAGSGTVSGTVGFNNVTIAGGVNFGSASNIVTSLQINSGAFVNTNAPTYGSGSTLIYNTGGIYGRGLEWNATSGIGYPNHVQIGNGVATTLNVVNGSNSYKKAAGNLTVNTGSAFSISSLTAGISGVGVEFLGNLVNDGTITLSGTTNQRLKGANFTNGNSNSTATTTLASNVGADLELTGNYLDNANFTANQRAIFFTGSGTQTISGTATAPFNIDYIVSAKASGSIQLGVDLLTGAPNTGNAITLTSATDILDLNGRTFTLGTNGLASTISGSGYIKGSAASKLIINGTGAFGTVRFDPSAGGTSNLLSNLTLNRTATGGFILGNDLIVSTDVSLTNGTITLGANNLTIGASGTITVTPSASNMIIANGAGQLRKIYTANGSFLFPIGDSTSNYTPATLNFTDGSYAAAYAGVNLTKAKQGNNASVTDYINRFWTVTTSGITSPTCTASFTYVTGDVAGTEANLFGGNYVSSSWKCLGTVNTTTHTISASVTDFGDFTAGEFTSLGCCINPTSGGTIAGAQTICIGATPTGLTSSTLSSGESGTLQYQWQSSTTSPGTSGFSNISGATGTTFSPSALSVTTWYRRQSKVTCSGTWASSGDSNTIQITVDTANTWNAGAGTNVWSTAGNWTCGVPAAGTDVTINTASFYPEIISNVTINSLTINSGTSLVVTSGSNLTVTEAVANSGTFTIENNANLKQTNNTTNTGSGSTIVKRNTAALMRQDYVLWSSPVSGQQLQAFSPATLSTRFYEYDSSGDVYSAVTPTINFDLAKGYLIRLPNTHPVTPTAWSGVFTGGNAHNGDVSLTGLTTGDYYAIGNPYPSAISADDFINNNSIGEALYFWRKTNNAANSSYATYTTAGGTSNSGGGSSLLPDGVIQVGQGFIAKAPATSMTIDNSMRILDNSAPFFRLNNNRSRIWLNLVNSTGYFGQAMVAYMPNATNGVDAAIDGRYINDYQTALTSIIDGGEFTIQGRALPFDAADVVPLSFKTTTAGQFTIALDHADGIFSDGTEAIYLRDLLTGTEQNLRTAAYTFTTETGVFNNRFELAYSSLLSVNPFNFTADQVVLYKQENEVFIDAGKTKISNVEVYDLRGRLLLEVSGIDTTSFHFTADFAQQVLLVRITATNGQTITKKLMN